jgi:hypothetical protein
MVTKVVWQKFSYGFFSRLILNFLAFLVVSLLIIAGTAPILATPIIADDLIVFAKGIAQISSSSNFLELSEIIFENIRLSTGYHHIMPMAGVIHFFQDWSIYQLLTVVPDPLLLFAIFRTCWHIFSLAAMSLFINELLLDSRFNDFRAFVTTFALSGISFISFTQIHSAWKESPIASYGIHGSGIAGIGFLYLFGIAKITRSKDVSMLKILTVLTLGTVGMLTYEMFIAPLLVGIVLYLHLSRKIFTFRQIFRNRSLMVVLIPFSLFLGSQLIRLFNSDKNYYDGTQFGDPNLIFPGFLTGMYGSLPLAYLDQAVRQVGFASVDFETSGQFFSSLLALLVVAWVANRKKVSDSSYLSASNRQLLIGLLIALWAIATLSFMAAAKYQNELGVELGKIYMFYAVGNLSIVGISVIWLLGSSTRMQILIVSLIATIGLYTNIYNAALVSKIQSNEMIKSYTYMFQTISDNDVPSTKKCAWQSYLRASNLPEYYKESLIPNFNLFYYNYYGSPFCVQSSV